MSILPPVLYRGSVKNVRGEVSAESLLFEFSDRYSIFDWGEMPDKIQDKGLALSIMGKSFFNYLENAKNWSNLFDSEILNQTFDSKYLMTLKNSELFKKYCETGMPHHALLKTQTIPWNSNLLPVKNISLLRPSINENNNYQYHGYKEKPVNTLVPLEIIFRLGLPKGNSLSKRLGQDISKWSEYGFNEIPNNLGLLKKPILDFSTKLEKLDRYLDYSEAKDMAALSASEWEELNVMTHLIALNLFHFHSKINLELWDGKIEVAFTDSGNGTRSFMLVDSVGIDELRLIYLGKSFSKEFMRETYKESEWFKHLEMAKKESVVSGEDFKEICLHKYNSSPEHLDPMIKERIEALYKSYCNDVSLVMNLDKPFPAEFSLMSYVSNYL